MSDDLYEELVLRCAERVPRGRVTTYGAIAEAVGQVLGRGGPRQVGAVMAREGGAVAWWRVVRADGSLAVGVEQERRLRAEGVPIRGGRVDLDTVRFPGEALAPGD